MKLPGANRLAAALKATAIVIVLVLSVAANAAYLTNMPHTITQPDKSAVNCLVSGDEFYNWIHDADGYVIVQDHSDGWFVYATLAGGDVVPTQYVVGSVKPADVGLAPNIKPSVQKLAARKATLFALPMEMDPQLAPQSGAINNIAIFIRFSDDTEFTDAASLYNTIFNSTTSGVSSMRNYFWETSYNVLTINTTFYPTPGGATVVSYQDTNPRAYYLPYDATTNPIGYTQANNASREHTLLANAVNAVKSQIPTGLNVDADNDGNVDNVCFIVKGATSNWGTLLWPHAWALYSQTVTINSKRVWGYNLQFGSWLMPSGVGVLAHEMMHTLGAPDLYHYTSSPVDPLGGWDVMCRSGNPPQYTCAYMKFKYMHWISTLPVISAPGAYTLNPLTSATGNCYKIAAAGTTSEFYVLEYRKKTGTFENSVPGSGLLVYRINTAVSGNSAGPPDEIYVYRPNGTTTVNGDLNNAFFNSSVGRTAINNGTNPAGFLTNGSLGGLNISNIGAAGATISFTVSFKLPNPTISPAGGTFTGSQTVTLAVPSGIGNVYYTTDGTTPDTSDPYVNSGGTIILSSSATLNAKAFYTGYTASDMVSAVFVVIPTYTITASAGPNGTISPTGAVSVTHGNNQTFTFTPNTGYVVDQVTIDGGAPVAAGASYTFTNVIANGHTIVITFKPAPTFTITASSDANGTISPTGAVSVSQGNNQTFTIAAIGSYRVSRVLVDGASVGAVTTYTFSNVTVAHTISAEFISTDFVAYWKFDETSGTSAYDWSGNGKNGTLVNTPTWTAGLFNNAVNIPGGTSYISVPSGIVFGLGNFSIATWVKMTTVATNMRIFDFGTTTTNYMELTPKHSDTNGVLQYVIRTPGTVNTLSGTTALPTGSWQHVAITRSGTTNKLYLNGVQVGTLAGTLSPNSLTSATINYIGDSQTSAHPHLDGLVDDFRIYNKALTAAEITDLYNTGVARTITATAGANGSVTPSGAVSVNYGANQIFTFSPSAGYGIVSMNVDGGSIVPVTNYPFNNVIVDHTISAAYAKLIGINNKAALNDAHLVGKVVKVWGKVTPVDGTKFTISDGYGTPITVNFNGVAQPSGFAVNKTVVVTGVLSSDKQVQAQTIIIYP